MGFIVIIVLFGAMYFAPALLAFSRRHHQRVAIAVLNVLLGWTVLGWVVAIVWAAMKPATDRVSVAS